MTTETHGQEGQDTAQLNRRAALRSTLAVMGATAMAPDGQAEVIKRQRARD